MNFTYFISLFVWGLIVPMCFIVLFEALFSTLEEVYGKSHSLKIDFKND